MLRVIYLLINFISLSSVVTFASDQSEVVCLREDHRSLIEIRITERVDGQFDLTRTRIFKATNQKFILNRSDLDCVRVGLLFHCTKRGEGSLFHSTFVTLEQITTRSVDREGIQKNEIYRLRMRLFQNEEHSSQYREYFGLTSDDPKRGYCRVNKI
tara:strand:+ start:523 stop:990 length:468 start_codon:yes stop_codon:yes gene_type:complete